MIDVRCSECEAPMDWQNEYREMLANEQASATAYAEVKAELAKVKMECSGMGKVLSSGVVISTEKYSALVSAQSELTKAKDLIINAYAHLRYGDALVAFEVLSAYYDKPDYGAEPKSRG